MQNTVNLIIQLISGALGGNLAGGLLKSSPWARSSTPSRHLGWRPGRPAFKCAGVRGYGRPRHGYLERHRQYPGGRPRGGVLMAIVGAIKKALGK